MSGRERWEAALPCHILHLRVPSDIQIKLWNNVQSDTVAVFVPGGGDCVCLDKSWTLG